MASAALQLTMAPRPPFDGYYEALEQLRRVDPMIRLLREQEQVWRSLNAYRLPEIDSGTMRMLEEGAAALQSTLQETYSSARQIAELIDQQVRQVADWYRPCADLIARQQLEVQEWYRQYAATALVTLEWESLRVRLQIDSITQLQRRTGLLESAYRNLVPELDSLTPSLSPDLLAIPPVEVFATGDLLAELSLEESTLGETRVTARAELRLEVQERVDEELGPALEGLAPALLRMLHGAREARRSRNPDRIRHLCISLRELVTQVLEALAPDEEVLLWLPSQKLLDGRGKPTRRARLLFACRRIDHDPFKIFIKRDVEATLALLDLLQKGTHRVETPFSDAQTLVLLQRIELLLFSLLLVTDEIN
jgi:hypothetical protein